MDDETARRIRELEAALVDRDHQLREQQQVVEDIVAGRGRSEDPSLVASYGHSVDPGDSRLVDGFGGRAASADFDEVLHGAAGSSTMSDEELARYLQAQEDLGGQLLRHEEPGSATAAFDDAPQEPPPAALAPTPATARAPAAAAAPVSAQHTPAPAPAPAPAQAAASAAAPAAVVVVDPELGPGRTLGGEASGGPPSWAADVRARRAARLAALQQQGAAGGGAPAAAAAPAAAGPQRLQAPEAGPVQPPLVQAARPAAAPAPLASQPPHPLAAARVAPPVPAPALPPPPGPAQAVTPPPPARRPAAPPPAAPPQPPHAAVAVAAAPAPLPPARWFSWGIPAAAPAPAAATAAAPAAPPQHRGGPDRTGRGRDDGVRPPDEAQIEMIAGPPVPLRGFGRRLDGGAVDNHEWDADAALAATLQQEEMLYAQQAQQAQQDDVPEMVDPVWGRFTPRNGRNFTPLEVMALSCCPCCDPPVCGPERKKAYARIGRTVAFWLSVLQIIALVAMLCLRGFAPLDVNGMIGPWPDTLDLFQAKNAAFIVYKGQLQRLVMPMMLHAGVIHIAANLAMQLRIGLYLEVEWGTWRFAQIYFGAGVFSSAFSALVLPNTISVGASGALMGIMGAWVVHIITHWHQDSNDPGERRGMGNRPIQLILALINIGIILGFSFTPNIDWAAHLFGLIGGIFLAMWLFAGPLQNPSLRAGIAWGGLAAFIGLLAIALGVLYGGTILPDKVLLELCPVLKRVYNRPDFVCYPLGA